MCLRFLKSTLKWVIKCGFAMVFFKGGCSSEAIENSENIRVWPHIIRVYTIVVVVLRKGCGEFGE